MSKIINNINGNYRDKYKKVNLSDVIPLDTPYMTYIEPSTFCNIQCKFCFHSLEDNILNEKGYKPNIMEYNMFVNIVDKFKEFPSKLRAFKLCGLGEPLLNKKLPEMIAYAKQREVADRIIVVTNGLLLNPELNLKLIEAGLDEIIISIEGVSSQKYNEIAGIDIDYGKFLSNIKHLYQNKGECKIYAKIVNSGLDDGGEEKFHKIFDDICDNAYVEYLSSIFDGVDYSNIINDPSINQLGDRLTKKVEVCFLPFYNMSINATGKVSPCLFDFKNSIVVGNVNEESLVDIWNGERMNAFRRMHLNKERSKHPDCVECEWLSICACGIYENIIDEDAEKLIQYFE